MSPSLVWKFISLFFLAFVGPILNLVFAIGITVIFFTWIVISSILWCSKELYLEGDTVLPIEKLDHYPKYIQSYARFGNDGFFVIKRRLLLDE
jgi:hypothetical protein